MGIDLSLCPFKHHPKKWDCHLMVERLRLDRDYSLFEQMGKDLGLGGNAVCKPQALPPDLVIERLTDEGLEIGTEGLNLSYLKAWELAQLKTAGTTRWNKAVFAMMATLDPETPVIVWWH